MDRVTAAEVFMQTVARGSISAAANDLNMSRAMASRYINLMEEWAGVRLLHRTTRQLSLTGAGEQVFTMCKKMVELAQTVSSVDVKGDTELRGQLRISASAIFVGSCLIDLLLAFLERYPAISIDLQLADNTVNLAQEGIDLAIRITNMPEPQLIARKLGSCPSIVCASPAYLTRHGTPLNVDELKHHNCLVYNNFSKKIWRFNLNQEEVTVDVDGNLSSNDPQCLLRAALQGTGIALLPKFAVNEFIAQQQLVTLLENFQPETLSVFAVYLSRQKMPASLRALIDFLLANLDLSGA